MEAVLQGPFGRTVLGPNVITIGRASDNQLVVKDQTTSSHHAEIRPGAYGYSLFDLSSTNGTFVNERKLEQHRPYLLQGGDRIRIGGVKFMYEEGSPSLQSQLMQEDSFDDEPTVQLKSSAYRANGRGEQWGYQPPATLSINTPQQQPAPQFFTPALQEPDSPHWGTGEITSYGMPVQQQPYTPLPIQPSYTPLPVQPSYKPSPVQPSYMPLPVQSSYAPSSVQLPYTPLPMQPPYTPSPVQPKPSNRLKLLLIIVSLILLLGVAGGGIAAYFLTRPQPVMSVTSAYNVASIPTGSTGTALHVNAHSFSGSSAITFLLDNVPVASSQKVNSDANGQVSADLTVTNAWSVGKHTLTAKDASGYTTKAGVTVSIVSQGQAHTPGPNGAPTDDMSFSLKANVQVQDAGTGKQLTSTTETLTVLGRPDPSGGTVCQAIDDGQPHIYNGSTSTGVTYRETFVTSCSGTYKAGKLTYTETVTSYKADFSDGLSCVAHTPFVFQHLEGSFTNPNTISGTLSGDSFTMDCNQGIGTQQGNASKGSWTAQM
jgi:pSer/pThr/pTyr-binding forkhead associated (FHA) protein